jgi:hypothetical protein
LENRYLWLSVQEAQEAQLIAQVVMAETVRLRLVRQYSLEAVVLARLTMKQD